MPYFVNGQPVAEDLIRREAEPIGRDLRWRSVPDEAERARRIRAAAEYAAVNRVLVQQAASADPRPVDAKAVAGEMQRLKAEWGCRSSFDDSQLRQSVERGLRIQRTTREMVAGAAIPTADQIEAFYDANRENFIFSTAPPQRRLSNIPLASPVNGQTMQPYVLHTCDEDLSAIVPGTKNCPTPWSGTALGNYLAYAKSVLGGCTE